MNKRQRQEAAKVFSTRENNPCILSPTEFDETIVVHGLSDTLVTYMGDPYIIIYQDDPELYSILNAVRLALQTPGAIFPQFGMSKLLDGDYMFWDAVDVDDFLNVSTTFTNKYRVVLLKRIARGESA